MRNFKDTFETRKLSFISAFTIFMTVPLRRGGPFSVCESAYLCKYGGFKKVNSIKLVCDGDINK